MKIIHFSLLATLMLTAVFTTSSSCKRNKYCKKGDGTCRSVLEAKDFFLFKEGSWWVYEEETTHERDSQYVYEYYNSGSWDFSMRMHSSLDDYNFEFKPVFADGAIKTCSESDPVSGKCIYIYKDKAKIGDYIGEKLCFFINYKTGDWTYVNNYPFPNSKLTINSLITSYTLNNLSFSDVVVINDNSTFLEHNQPTNHYYAKKVGLIKKELLDSNQVWNLVNYHIEQ